MVQLVVATSYSVTFARNSKSRNISLSCACADHARGRLGPLGGGGPPPPTPARLFARSFVCRFRADRRFVSSRCYCCGWCFSSAALSQYNIGIGRSRPLLQLYDTDTMTTAAITVRPLLESPSDQCLGQLTDGLTNLCCGGWSIVNSFVSWTTNGCFTAY